MQGNGPFDTLNREVLLFYRWAKKGETPQADIFQQLQML
jgi:hypothetical protein